VGTYKTTTHTKINVPITLDAKEDSELYLCKKQICDACSWEINNK
jgi:hypothetical protein